MSERVTIRCRANGPLVVPASAVRLVDAKGDEIPVPTEKELLALCRCGQSGKKPFCDGTHKSCDFRPDAD